MSNGLRSRLGWLGGLAVLAFLLFAPLGSNRYGLYILSQWAVMTIAAIGLNLTLGYAGQVSLAQGAFVGVGAYSAAILTTHGWPLGLAILIAIALCFAIGWILGYPALRVQHHYLAFVTLAFSTLAFLVFRNEAWLTGGTYGIDGIPRPVILGIVDQQPHLAYLLFLPHRACARDIGDAGGWSARPGAAPSSPCAKIPLRALSLGVDTRRYTLMAFAIGAALGGLAGALYAPLVGLVEPPAVYARALAQSPDDGDRRRLRLLLRAVPRSDGRGAAAGMAALSRELLPHALCAPGDGAPDLFADGPDRHSRPLHHSPAHPRRLHRAGGAERLDRGPVR